MPSSRFSPFSFTFLPNGSDNVDVQYKSKDIPINKPPVEIENANFKGKVLLLHDTGNEPPNLKAASSPDGKRRGVELQIQGKFKNAASKGAPKSSGLWVGGELQDNLKLGWVMKNVLELCAKYARKKNDGRIHFIMGNKDKAELPFLAWPIQQLFFHVVTPPGQVPPEMGSDELRSVKWAGHGELPIDPESTYTFFYNTPYLDVCSWELLKVPGVSPMPIETLMGDLSRTRLTVYDLGLTGGSHTNWRKGVLVEFIFSRGSEGDPKLLQNEGEVQDDDHASSRSVRTPLEEHSDDSEGSDHMGIADEDHPALVVADDIDAMDDESESSDESIDSVDIEALSVADSHALDEIPNWRPRLVGDASSNISLHVPYYIEAIDRWRRRKVRVWYVFNLTKTEDSEEWWHAKAASELAALCQPRRRLRTFRRGPGARRYSCCAVKTLEQFRHVVREHIAAETKLRRVVITQGTMETGNAFSDAASPRGQSGGAAGLAQKVMQKGAKLRRRGQIVPPRFFVGQGVPMCGLAFVKAREGRNQVLRETLVGAVHYEGRLCEELLRLSSDGFVRCFTPYDCAIPRLRLIVSEILRVERVEGLFLGRFSAWRVHTNLRVLVFCSATAKDADEWVEALTNCNVEKMGEAAQASKSQHDSRRHSDTAEPAGTLHSTSRRQALKPQEIFRHRPRVFSNQDDICLPRDLATLLMDSTRARRWRNNRRLVLNDRQTLEGNIRPARSNLSAIILGRVLAFGEEPATNELIAFMDITCQLKTIRFNGWNQEELLSFWLNVYHSLLLHGWLLLGTPKSKTENRRFYSRVSYLVGTGPMSLAEIERIVLHLPRLDPKMVQAQARARASQILGFCACLRRSAYQADSDDEEEGLDGSSKGGPSNGGQGSNMSRNSPCLPMPNLPKIPWNLGRTNACLFLGDDVQPIEIPQQDFRAILTVNRGNKCCLSCIPVFEVAFLNAALNDITKQFVQEFVKVQECDGKLLHVTLPYSCMALKNEMARKSDAQAFLKFLWGFMPEGQEFPIIKTKMKFGSVLEIQEMRQRVELQKATFTDPSITQHLVTI